MTVMDRSSYALCQDLPFGRTAGAAIACRVFDVLFIPLPHQPPDTLVATVKGLLAERKSSN